MTPLQKIKEKFIKEFSAQWKAGDYNPDNEANWWLQEIDHLLREKREEVSVQEETIERFADWLSYLPDGSFGKADGAYLIRKLREFQRLTPPSLK